MVGPVPPLRRIRPVGLELTGFVETMVLAPGPMYTFARQ